ncbi:DUF427 domain-containing protein [Phenylobacterium terrae]|uniref:DUF427 domain-containing protein n=1 Tax=Phenylobacterium terrae TaxID=2665495 RepID=A0ABW4N3H0_9CAUL
MTSPIRVERAGRRWRALFAGHLIADSDDAVIVHEQGLNPVVYFPRESVSMEYMSRTDKTSRCPYKGDATYYTLLMDGNLAENGVWSYESPIDEELGMLAGHVAFDPRLVDVYEADEKVARAEGDAGPEDRARVDEVVKHTDTGAGYSQREHWAPNVRNPES